MKKTVIRDIDVEELKCTYLSTDENFPSTEGKMIFRWVQRLFVFYPDTCELEDRGVVDIDLTDNVPEFLRRWIAIHGWDDMAICWARGYNVSSNDITLAIGKEKMREDELCKTLVDKGIRVTSGKYLNLF